MFYVYLYLMIGMVVTYAMDKAFGYRLPNKFYSCVLHAVFIIAWLPLFLWGGIIAFQKAKEKRTKNT